MNRIPTLLETRPTLLVVGLQEEPLTETKCFPALPDIIRAYTANVERIIRERARAAHQIVFAEVPGAGPTMPRFLAAAAETATVVMPARRHGSPQELENIDTGSICCALSPLVGSRAGVEVIGINAGASVADAALALSDTGYLVRVLGDGILNHYA